MTKRQACVHCIHCVAIPVNEDMYCRLKGAVSRSYRCSRYKPEEAQTGKAKVGRCLDCENFIPAEAIGADLPHQGHCKLFTVRSFDGATKPACSKYVRCL